MKKESVYFKYLIVIATTIALFCAVIVLMSGCQSKEELEAELDAAVLNVMESSRFTIDMTASMKLGETEESVVATIKCDADEETTYARSQVGSKVVEQYLKWGYIFRYESSTNSDYKPYYATSVNPVSSSDYGDYVNIKDNALINLDPSLLEYSIGKSRKDRLDVYKVTMGIENALTVTGSFDDLSEMRKYIDFNKNADCYFYVEADLLTKISMSFEFEFKNIPALSNPYSGKKASVSLTFDFTTGGDFVIGSTPDMDEYETAYTDSDRVNFEEYYGENGIANGMIISVI